MILKFNKVYLLKKAKILWSVYALERFKLSDTVKW